MGTTHSSGQDGRAHMGGCPRPEIDLSMPSDNVPSQCQHLKIIFLFN